MLSGLTWMSLACLYLGGCGGSAEPFMIIAGPKDLVHFELRDARGETVWAMHADVPQTLDFIAYGRVPLGFTQRHPANGSEPRALRPGETLTTEIRSLKRVFIHRGIAENGSRFSIYDWSMHPLDRP